MLLTTYVAMSKPNPAPIVLATMAKDLAAELNDTQLLRGLARLRKEREWVSVKAIIELSGAAEEDGRPGVEAAWAMCPKTEEASVVWTEEIAEAFGACRPLLLGGDDVGARMAFKETYTQILSRARVSHAAARWVASLGWDKADRVRALSDAVVRGRLAAANAIELIGDQAHELRLALPAAKLPQLTGEVTGPRAIEQLTGLDRCLAVLAADKQIPAELTAPRDTKRFPNGNARMNVALTQARALGEQK